MSQNRNDIRQSTKESPEQERSSTATKPSSVLAEEDPTKLRIISLVKDLCNPVLSKRRAMELHILKHKQPEPFQQTAFFHKVMKLLEQYHFRLPVLRFVIDLFDKRVMRRIVLDEESDDSESDHDDSGPGMKASDTKWASVEDD